MEVWSLDSAGEEFLMKWEAFRSKPYLCPAGKWTQGYGSTINMDTGQRVRMSDPPISKATAARWKRLHVEKLCNPVIRKLIKIKLNQNEYNAVASFVYNSGGFYKNAKDESLPYLLFTHINNRLEKTKLTAYWKGCAITAGGKRLKGLVNRRAEEVWMFFAEL